MNNVWIDGKPNNHIPSNNRGLAYGDGLFETIKVINQLPTLATLHWQRLQYGLLQLNIQLNFTDLLTEIKQFLLQQNRSGILKIIITRGDSGRGYNPYGCSNPTRILSFHPLSNHTNKNSENGIHLFCCQIRLSRSVLAGIKHLNRLENVLARAEWQNSSFQEGLLLDFNNNVIEGTMSNIFMKKNNIVYTPSLHECGVDGVCRQFIIEQLKQLHYTVIIKQISKEFLMTTDELFVCNSVNGIWPIISYNTKHWEIGTLTTKISQILKGLLDEKTP